MHSLEAAEEDEGMKKAWGGHRVKNNDLIKATASVINTLSEF